MNPIVAPLGIAAVFLFLIVLMFIERTRVLRALEGAYAALVAWDPSADDPHVAPGARFRTFLPSSPSDVRSHFRSFLLEPTRVHAPSWPTGRLILGKPVPEVLSAYVHHRLSRTRFMLASLSTGIALVCTFFLIGRVLMIDVSNAIGSGSGASDNAALSRAVEQLGEKFFISMVGVLFAVVYAITAALIRSTLYAAAERAANRIAPLTSTPEAYSAAVLVAAADDLRRLRNESGAGQAAVARELHSILEQHRASPRQLDVITEQLSAGNARLADLATRVDRLHSIEVSVKDLGTEVHTHLRNLLRQDLGDQLREMINDVMLRTDEIARHFEDAVVAAMRRTVEEEVPKIEGHLAGIRESVDRQAQAPIEQLIEKFQQAISGGFRGESASMNAAMKEFASTLPGLANELRSLTERMGNEIQTQTAESARVTATLLERVSGLVTTLQGQQESADGMVARLAEASAASTGQLVHKLESDTTAMIDGLLGTSRAQISELLDVMRAAAAQNMSSVGELHRDARGLLEAAERARHDLEASALQIRNIGETATTLLLQAQQATEAARSTAVQFTAAGKGLESAATLTREVVEATRGQAKEQQALLAGHKAYVEELQRVWPDLCSKYVRSFKEESDVLARSWDDIHVKLERLASSVSGGLVEAADELKASVDRLVAHADGNQRARTA